MRRLLAVLVLAGASAQAEIVYYFEGNLSDNIAGLSAGTPFQGSFRYDENQPYEIGFDQDGVTIKPIHYSYFEVLIRGQSFLGNNTFPQIMISDSGTLSIFRHPSANNGGEFGGWFEGLIIGFGITLKEFSSEKINLGSIPDSSLRLSNLIEAFFIMSEYENVGSGQDEYAEIKTVNSNLTSLVPEPSSLSLLLAGGAVFAAARRRKVD